MDEDPNKPKLSIVASNDRVERPDPDVDHHLHRLEWRVRHLAANMIRIIRGAGRPQQLFDDFRAIFELIDKAPEGVTIFQFNEAMEEALQSGLSSEEEESEHRYAVNEMQRGALRMVAARLLQQQVQVSVGNRDFWDGFYSLERARERQREEHLREQAARRKLTAATRTPHGKARVPTKTRESKPKKRPVPFTERYPSPSPPKAALTAADKAEERPTSTAEFMKQRQREMRGEA